MRIHTKFDFISQGKKSPWIRVGKVGSVNERSKIFKSNKYGFLIYSRSGLYKSDLTKVEKVASVNSTSSVDGVAYDDVNNIFIVTSYNKSYRYSGENFSTKETITFTSDDISSFDSIGYGPKGFFLNGIYKTSDKQYYARIWTSPDGKTWTRRVNQLATYRVFPDLNLTKYVNGIYLVTAKYITNASSGSSGVFTSTDLVSWTFTQVPGISWHVRQNISFTNNLFFHHDWQQDLYKSTDGKTWTEIPNFPFSSSYDNFDVEYYNGTYYINTAEYLVSTKDFTSYTKYKIFKQKTFDTKKMILYQDKLVFLNEYDGCLYYIPISNLEPL